jgi:SnoaL-like polyketide cyclase
MTSTAENKMVVDEFIQALFTKGDLLAVDRNLADDIVAHDPPMAGLSGDAAGFRDAATTLRAAFPDFTERAQVGALKLLLASDCMLIPGRKACRYREQP